MNNLTTDYENTIEMFENELSANTLTLKTVQERLRAKFHRMTKTKKENEDVALVTRQFKSMCNVCGKIGHKGKDCFTLEKNKAKKEEYFKKHRRHHRKPLKDVTCYKCGKKGHYASKCSTTRSTTPNETEKESEKALITQEVNKQFCIMTSSTDKFEENIWIADSGATAHMVNSIEGFQNFKETQGTITIGNGEGLQIKGTGTWKGVMKNQNGKETPITLKEVEYVPDLMCNLFSMKIGRAHV